jgi:hypothetical protein
MPLEPQPPIVLAMVLADTVLVDVATGKNTIQGTYQTLVAPAFPYTHAAVVVYVALTEGHGATTVQLRLVDRDEARPPIFELESQVSFPDPLTDVEIVFAQPGVVFPEPGEYRLQLFAGNAPLLERRLEISPEEDSETD